jgi:hypothetical protein
VQGAVKFTASGENTAQHGLIFQWQNGQFLPVLGSGTGETQVLASKPPWGQGG